jgi:hypothetical protein
LSSLKASRLESTFCFPTHGEATDYRNRNDLRGQVLHRVELADHSAVQHIGAVGLLAWPAPNTSFLDVSTANAQAYWRGDGEGTKEIVSASALRVLECLE